MAVNDRAASHAKMGALFTALPFDERIQTSGARPNSPLSRRKASWFWGST